MGDADLITRVYAAVSLSGFAISGSFGWVAARAFSRGERSDSVLLMSSMALGWLATGIYLLWWIAWRTLPDGAVDQQWMSSHWLIALMGLITILVTTSHVRLAVRARIGRWWRWWIAIVALIFIWPAPMQWAALVLVSLLHSIP